MNSTLHTPRFRYPWLLAAALVVALLLVGNWRLLTGQAAPQWDAIDFFAPNFFLVADHAKAGKLLLWNPWVDGGSPDWAEPELGTTSPLMLLVALLTPNPKTGFIAYWMTLWALGGIGMLLLSRHLKAPAWGGLLAALGYAASGFYTGHAEHTSSICSISFLPWIVWRLDAALHDRNWWCGVQAGALYGLSALGGYPELTILTPGLLALWAVGRVILDRRGSWRRRAGFAMVVLALTGAIGAAVWSPPYMGILTATRGYSDHIGPRSRVESLSSNLLPAGALSTFASPYLAVLNLPPNPVWPTDVSMTGMYSGAVLLVFALFGAVRACPWRWWLAGMGLFFLGCSLGNQLPVRGWLYDWVPPTRYFRNPALFRIYVIFLIAVLGASGSRALTVGIRRRSSAPRCFWIIASLTAAAAAISFAVVTHVAGKRVPGFQLSVVHMAIVWCGLAVFGYLLTRQKISGRVFYRLVGVLAILDAFAALQISRPTLYTEATLPWWNGMQLGHRSQLDLSGFRRDLNGPEWAGTYPNNRNIAIKIPTLRSYVTLWNRFDERFTRDAALSRMALGSERLCFAPEAPSLAPVNRNFESFVQRVHASGAPALVVHSPEQMLALTPRETQEPAAPEVAESGRIPACSPAPASNVDYSPNRLSFRYVAPASGWLLVTDRWAPGWQATVNGAAQPLFGGNFIFRVIRVAAGQNEIAFRYRPAWFYPLLVLSWGVLAVIAGVELWKLAGAVIRCRS